MSAPDWLESLEEHIDREITREVPDTSVATAIRFWRYVLEMIQENIDTMEGH